MKHILYFFLIPLIIFGCEEEKEVLEEVTPGWEEPIKFSKMNKILLNSKVVEDELTIASAREVNVIGSDHRIKNKVHVNFLHNIYPKPAIHKRLAMYISELDQYQMYLYSPYYPPCDGNYGLVKAISLHELAPEDFNINSRVVFPFPKGPIGAFNENGDFLMVVQDNGKTTLCFMNFTYTEKTVSGESCIDLETDVKLVSPIDVYNSNFINFIEAIGPNFFISLDHYPLLKVDSHGNMTETDLEFPDGFGTVKQIIELNQELYAFTSNKTVYKSSLEGDHWELVKEKVEKSIGFFVVDGELCYYNVNGEFFKFDLASGEFILLNNPGMERNTITSVSYFNDKVWVTTLNGLFTKHKDDFLQYAKKLD
ncbi:hypothetical protein AAG747_28130 [Rapidithrix thailandica]|uniref:Uncharacterized protein n=1 Tax=Rapidithrix thailandica TaxID=413964 RepID=A0AAW9S3T5_9BACT